MFLGIIIFLALLRTHLNLRYAWTKMSLSPGQKHIYACEHQLIVIIICFYSSHAQIYVISFNAVAILSLQISRIWFSKSAVMNYHFSLEKSLLLR